MILIARSNIGACDLYHGSPDLTNAVIMSIEYGEDGESTKLNIRDVTGEMHCIIIKPNF